MSRLFKTIFFSFSVVMLFSCISKAQFKHPGILHSRADLERMKRMVGQGINPWKSGFEIFSSDPASKANYRLRGPVEEIGRNPSVNFNEFDQDANAAYQCALMWAITGDKVYADKAKQIINAWSDTLKRVSGRDAVLMAGLGPFKMINAAEIIRYTDTSWSKEEIQQCERMFLNVIYPTIKDYALFANGNWDLAAVQTVMAIGVFCNDRAIFENGLRYYVNGAGNGRLTHYIIKKSGQCQESGRDQGHTQLGLALLSVCCEIAWNQGLDLFAYADYRLLKGFEYTAKYNLGEDVQFQKTLDRTGKYHHSRISSRGRGDLRAVYEQVYNHYANRAGMDAPYTQKAAERVRPEGPGRPSADHPGFGTLLFSLSAEEPFKRPSAKPPASPGGIIGKGTAQQTKLTYVSVVDAAYYTIKRAEVSGGPYSIIAGDIESTTYTDTNVEPGNLYYYVISASNETGKSPNSIETCVCAGLSKPWIHQDVGETETDGDISFDGNLYTLEAAGSDIGGNSDQFHFMYVPLTGDGTITARYVPQISSQFSKFGLMMREDCDNSSAHVSLLIMPHFDANIEQPEWYARLITRDPTNKDTFAEKSLSSQITNPIVQYGRLMGPCWLRLQRKGNTFSAAISPDGQTWFRIGEKEVLLNDDLLTGLAACSGLTEVTTIVKFDNVAVSTESHINRITSPDGNVGIDFVMLEEGVLSYKIDYMGEPIVLTSRLGFEPNFKNGFELLETSLREHSSQWTNDFGERKIIPDNYKELNVDLKHLSGRLLRLTFRAYNEGAALRYSFPQQQKRKFTFTEECTEFCFPPDTYGYEAHGTEDVYRRTNTDDIQPYCERPLTLEYSSGLFACLAEAANTAYPRMMLSPHPKIPTALISALGGTTSNTPVPNQRHDSTVRLSAGESTPWRVFVLGEKPGDLLERNYLILNLNPPSAIEGTCWIKPGKVMRDTTLTTKNSKAIIDFAATAGLKYVHLDWQWYGSEDFETGDATTVRVPNLDLEEIINYGNEKDAGLILYVDRRQIKKQRDILFPLYERWGIKGIKIGFVDVGPQEETAWITETIQKAAEHHLMLNIHDGYRATGNNRTYPNLMTVEGIRGNEHMPSPEHNCTLPFTRYIAGIGDYTVCYYDNRIKTTHAHQLAMAVISFSPLQWIFWYDNPSMYKGEPEIEFFRKVPTVWDETKVINGRIGAYATIARRSSDDWFIGTINNSQPRQLQIPLKFLNEGMDYIAKIYSDDDTIKTRTKVAIKTRHVNSTMILDMQLKAGGGQAVWITPNNESSARE